MLHFGCTTEVDTYIKKFLVIFHAGFLLLEKLYLLDVDLIPTITGMSRSRSDLVAIFEKGKNLAHIAKFKEKYDLVTCGKELLISPISDPSNRMEETILTHILLHVS